MENKGIESSTSGTAQPSLRKVLGVVYIWALASATILGPWLILANWWFSFTGPSLFLAYLILMFMMIPVGLCYAELTPILPWAGGSYNFIGHAFGTGVSFIFMWWQIICYFAVIAFNILAPIYILQYAGVLPETTEALIGAALLFAIFYCALNWFKIELSAGVQFALFWLLFITGIIWNGFGLMLSDKWNPSLYYSNFLPNGIGGFLAAMGVMITMYFGFEVVAHMAQELKFPPKKAIIPVIGSIVTAGFVYVVTLAAMAGVAPYDWLVNTPCMPGEIVFYVWGRTPWAYVGWIGIILGGIACALTCVDGFWLALSRLFYALGEANLFPKAFARINRHGVPGIANLMVFAGTAVCIAFSGTAWIQTLFVMMAVGIAATYFGVTLSFVKLRKSHPEWKRPYKVPAGYVVGGIAVIVSAYCFYYSAVCMTIEGWMLSITFLILGAIMYVYMYNVGKRKGIKPELKPPVE
jgi:APA family basic amino acid/polyamine antiporter